MKCPVCGKKMKKVQKKYDYIESGLENVILTDFHVYACECGEEMLEINNIEGLNRSIAKSLVEKDRPLTGREFRFLRKQMGLKEKEIASLLGVTPISVSRWENSNSKIGMSNDKLLRVLYIQTLEEHSNKVFKDVLQHIRDIKRSGKQNPIEISYKSINEYEKHFNYEHKLALKFKSIIQENHDIGLCEQISKTIKETGISDNPLLKIIEQLPKQLCPIIYEDMLKAELQSKVDSMVDELFKKGSKREPSVSHQCQVKKDLYKFRNMKDKIH